MGQLMGTLTTKHLDLKMNQNPTFPIDKGFKYKREQRAGSVSEDQLSSAKIPLKYRDYCASQLLEFQVCRFKHMPFLLNCSHQKHAYLTCERDDYVIRMKEFERERRLRERELRICPPPPPPKPAPTPKKKGH